MLTSSRPVQATRNARVLDAGAGQHVCARAAPGDELHVHGRKHVGDGRIVIDHEDFIVSSKGAGQRGADLPAADDHDVHRASIATPNVAPCGTRATAVTYEADGLPGPQIRRPQPRARSRRHRHRHFVPGARHRRQRHALQRRRRRPDPVAAVCRPDRLVVLNETFERGGIREAGVSYQNLRDWKAANDLVLLHGRA